MRTPNLNALRMFDAAARHLNFRLAAEELNLTQGAVAQQVRRLEAELGQTLFHREARGLALTEVGRRYHEPVHRALSMIEAATQNLQPSSGTVTLSVTPSFASKWLVPRLASFADAHPDLDLRTSASTALSNFTSDGVDIAIRLGHPPFGPGLEAILLSPFDLCAASSPGYASEVGPIDRIEQFASHRLLQDSLYLWERLLNEVGAEPKAKMVQFNYAALAVDAAINDQGIALAPRLLVHDHVAKGQLVILWRDTGVDRGGYYIVYPAGSKSSPARDAVVRWVLSEVA